MFNSVKVRATTPTDSHMLTIQLYICSNKASFPKRAEKKDCGGVWGEARESGEKLLKTQYLDHSHYNRNFLTCQTGNLLEVYAIGQLTVNIH